MWYEGENIKRQKKILKYPRVVKKPEENFEISLFLIKKSNKNTLNHPSFHG